MCAFCLIQPKLVLCVDQQLQVAPDDSQNTGCGKPANDGK